MVKITSPFLRERMERLADAGIAHQWKMCDETGRLDNFRRAATGEGEFEGRLYNDSDVYKLLEASLYAAAEFGGEELRKRNDQVVALIEGAQWDDGYIGNVFKLKYKGMLYKALASAHELYCMGHLLEACSAAAELGLSNRLVQVGVRMVDHLVDEFGEGGRQIGYCGHQELELALVRWGNVQGDDRAVALSQRMTDLRGIQPSPLRQQFDNEESKALLEGYRGLVFRGEEYVGEYCQDDMPIREQTKAVGHSVRAMYQFCGALDGYPDDAELISALESIWDNMVSRRMYITGGIGSASRNEGFTQDYDLPNYDAYCESCAGIGLAMWGSRMSKATGKAHFMEVFEQVVLNNVLAGISLDTCLYHYVNPLASRGNHRREEWFECACCPPNLARFILSLGRYVAWQERDEIVLGLLVGMEGEFGKVSIKVESGWPYEGGAVVSGVNRSGGPVSIRYRHWQRGWETVEVDNGHFTFSVEGEFRPSWMKSNPEIAENVGRVALMHGPMVYCLEEVDLGFPVTQFQVATMGPLVPIEPEHGLWKRNYKVAGELDQKWDSLYSANRAETYVHTTELVPYFAWNNREASSMQVWIAEA